MLRGINKQEIFHEEDDYLMIVRILSDIHIRKDLSGKVISQDDCEIYAYCIMPNHIHILLRERNLPISDIMKRIEDRFVIIYNKKYERVGHLFQARFKSEPVNDLVYLKVLLRYIHRNPVKGLICEKPEDYPWSSWREYTKGQPPALPVCKTSVPLHYFALTELEEWVNLDTDDKCMDMDSAQFVNTDSHAWQMLSELTGLENIEDFKQTPAEYQMQYLRQVISKGVSIRKASRLSSLTYYYIQKNVAEKSTEGSDTLIDDFATNLSERQQKIIEVIDNNPSIRINDIAEIIGTSRDTIYRDVNSINKTMTLFYDRNTHRWYKNNVAKNQSRGLTP